MNFNDPKVRTRVMQHVTFAVETATAAFSELENIQNEEIKALMGTLKAPIIMQLLNFTLSLDYQLKNSMTGSDKGL